MGDASQLRRRAVGPYSAARRFEAGLS